MPIEIDLATRDGYSIPLFYYPAKTINKQKMIIQILHGMAEHHEYYSDFIDFFNAKGFDIYIHDQRGHGSAIKDIKDLGFISAPDPANNNPTGGQLLLNDSLEITNYIINTHSHSQKVSRIVLIGNSMGALIAQHLIMDIFKNKREYLNLYNKDFTNIFSHLILTGHPGYNPKLLLSLGRLAVTLELLFYRGNIYRKSLVGHCLMQYWFSLKFLADFKSFSWITSDEKWLNKFLSDPKCGFSATCQFWLDIIHELKYIKNITLLKAIDTDINITFFDGKLDPVNFNNKFTQSLIKKIFRITNKKIQHIRYSKARHHLFIETNREEFYNDILKVLT